jgi:hypothetical protein
VKKNPTVGSPFFGAFHSDRIPKATKDINTHFFIHSSNSCILYQKFSVHYTKEFRELFEATAYIWDKLLHSTLAVQDNLPVQEVILTENTEV